MHRSVIPPRVSQPTLFRPVPPYPTFQMMPSEIQAKTIRLLARLLRAHVDHAGRTGSVREGRDE